MTACRGCGIFAAAAVIVPRPADAHVVTTGLGPFHDGVMHLLLSPAALLGVVALSLLAGVGGVRHGRIALFALPLAWLAGALGGVGAELSPPAGATVLPFLATGALIAAGRTPAPAVVLGLAAVTGVVYGLADGRALAPTDGAPLALLGSLTGVFALVALVSALVVSLEAAWTRVAVRVAGSWIAGVGLLMLGWSYRLA